MPVALQIFVLSCLVLQNAKNGTHENENQQPIFGILVALMKNELTKMT